VRVCPGWAQYDDMGILDPETGGRGIREWSWQSTYQALELLRLLGHAERRQERGRRASKNRAVSVYFRTPLALTGVIAELDRAVRS